MRIRLKKIFEIPFIGSNQLSPLYKKIFDQDLYSRADQLITPTPYAKAILEGYGIKVPICAISNGIDLDKYRPEPKRTKAFATISNCRRIKK